MPLQDAPATAGALADFPACSISGRWHRVWRHDLPNGTTRHDPWWFASVPVGRPGGRFDLPPAVGGTCYLASSPTAAVLEVFQEHLPVLPVEELQPRRRVIVDAPEEAPRAADATAPAATGFGITSGLWSTPDRAKTQGLAAAFRRDGWWAVRSGVHHDVTGHERALALFDLPGHHQPTHAGTWVTSAPATLHDDAVLLDALERHGVRPSGPANLPTA